jgi:hypothetical protein
VTSTEKKDGIGCVFMVLISPLTSILNGYVLSLLWSWFLVPTFHIPALNIPQAIGISIIVHKLTYFYQGSSSIPKPWESIGVALFAPLFTLCTGWIVRMFL